MPPKKGSKKKNKTATSKKKSVPKVKATTSASASAATTNSSLKKEAKDSNTKTKKKAVTFVQNNNQNQNQNQNQNNNSKKKKNEHKLHISFAGDVESEHDALEEEQQRLIIHRNKHEAIDPKEAHKKDHFEQAFSLNQIPVVLKTDELTVAELKAELKARSLNTQGPKEHLQKRLELFLKEFEGHRLDEAIEEEKEIEKQLHPAAAAGGKNKKKK